jgi:hypothetical protein
VEAGKWYTDAVPGPPNGTGDGLRTYLWVSDPISREQMATISALCRLKGEDVPLLTRAWSTLPTKRDQRWRSDQRPLGCGSASAAGRLRKRICPGQRRPAQIACCWTGIAG